MRIAIAPDSFKESLSAHKACEAVADGVRAVDPDAEIVSVPMADGGEGTVQAMAAATDGQLLREEVEGPLGETVEAEYGILGDGSTAVIEMAAASGLPLVAPGRRNPLETTTRGTGMLVRAALDRGVDRIIMGIGGSATVDGGAGMAVVLGVGLLDGAKRRIEPSGGGLQHLASVDMTGLDEKARHAEFLVACDVDNPLLGERGAARVYGPQKGATPEVVEVLEANLTRFADVVERDLGKSIRDVPGAGAAGGLGAGLMAFLDAALKPGIDIIIEAVGLRERIEGCDLVVTGEGQLDGQSAFGKTPIGVARVAKSLGIPAIAMAGSIGAGAETVLTEGIDAYFSILDGPRSLDEAIRDAAPLLSRAAEQAFRCFLSGRAT